MDLEKNDNKTIFKKDSKLLEALFIAVVVASLPSWLLPHLHPSMFCNCILLTSQKYLEVKDLAKWLKRFELRKTFFRRKCTLPLSKLIGSHFSSKVIIHFQIQLYRHTPSSRKMPGWVGIQNSICNAPKNLSSYFFKKNLPWSLSMPLCPIGMCNRIHIFYYL